MQPSLPTLDFYLLGELPFSRWLTLQRRVVESVASGLSWSVPVILCEHPRRITVGRGGSRSHIRLTKDELESRQVDVEWVARGGGCIPHGPGQLAIYPLLPLQDLGWTVGHFLRSFQRGLEQALSHLQVTATRRPETGFGIWGASGLLAALGVHVAAGTTSFGAYLNVGPEMSLFRFVETVPVASSLSASEDRFSRRASAGSMTCLTAERRGALPMSRVRAAVIEGLAHAFGAPEHHIHTGHPWLTSDRQTGRGGGARRAV